MSEERPDNEVFPLDTLTIRVGRKSFTVPVPVIEMADRWESRFRKLFSGHGSDEDSRAFMMEAASMLVDFSDGAITEKDIGCASRRQLLEALRAIYRELVPFDVLTNMIPMSGGTRSANPSTR